MEKFCLKDIYSRLGDDESRFLFEKRLNWSLTDDTSRLVSGINRESIHLKKILNTSKELFLFGAGYGGHTIANAYPQIPWRAFIDNDQNKVGKPDILPIISFQEFIKKSENALVYITSLYSECYTQIYQQLVSNGFPRSSIVSALFGNQYFDLPCFKPQKNEFFIDAGGHNGSTTKDFFQWLQNNNGEGGRSIVFEPNIDNCNICKNNLHKWDCHNVKIENKGLWHKKETIKFHKEGFSSCIDSEGDDFIETISLDEYLENEKEPVTFIKMDIEGAELNALKGAEKIIKEHKPKLAISIYHKPEDIWEIPDLLLNFVPDYKFYIRHYSIAWIETVLYAICD